MRRALPDPFRDFKHLADFDLYAGDGHFIAAASHDKAALRKSPSKNKTVGRTAAFTATGHLYSLCLRSHCLTHNLMTLMEEQIFRETGIHNEAEIKRKAETLAARDKDSKIKGSHELTDRHKAIQRLTQRTVKFIRWLNI